MALHLVQPFMITFHLTFDNLDAQLLVGVNHLSALMLDGDRNWMRFFSRILSKVPLFS